MQQQSEMNHLTGPLVAVSTQKDEIFELYALEKVLLTNFQANAIWKV